MKIYNDIEQRNYYKHKAFLDSEYKNKIRDSLMPGKDSESILLTEEFSIIVFKKTVEGLGVNIYGYNLKNLEIREIKPSSRDWMEQVAVVAINKRLIRFKIATGDKLFNKSYFLNEINFKMRKLLSRI